MAASQSIHEIAKELRLDWHTVRTWLRKKCLLWRTRKNRNLFLCSMSNGRKSILEPFKNEILQYIFKLCKQSVAITVTMVMDEARMLSGDLRAKSREAQELII